MSAPPLTPQEREVLRALRTGRPRRNLHIYAMLAVGALFLGIAAYKAITHTSSTDARVSERSGPKATTDEPSAAALKALIEKQSAGAPLSHATVTPAQAGAQSPLVIPPAVAPVQTGAPFPPVVPAQAATQSSPVPPLPLDFGPGGSMFPGREVQSHEADRKLAEASYMTAKTEVYIDSSSPLGGSTFAGSPLSAATRATPVSVTGAADSDLASIIAKSLATSRDGTAAESKLADSRITDSRELARMLGASRPNAEDRIAARTREQERFAESAGSPASSRAAKPPLRSTAKPDLPWVAEGTLIPAVLVRAVATNLPGQIEARVTSDVYDSAHARRVLIPKGSRLIGVYNANVAMGQERLQAAFTRLIFPSGASIDLENASGSDLAGGAGFPAEVDNHFARIFGSALAVGLLSWAVERRTARDAAAGQGSGTAVNVYGGATTSASSVAAQTFANVTNQILDRNLSIGPTLTVPAGTRINVSVARDLAIDPEVVL